MSLDGGPGSGRTRFALTAPRPLYIVQLDPGGIEGVLEDATDVQVAKYDFRKDLTKDDAKHIAREVEDDIIRARDEARSVIIDKGTFLWQLFRLAEFGRLSKERSRNYEYVSTRMSELLRAYVETDTNLLIVHDQGAAYEGDVQVGTKRAGYSGIEGIVRHALMFGGGKGATPFTAEVTKATTNWGFVGTKLEGEDINFANYAAQAVPQCDPEVWL
jgi:hypothetical protein